LKYLLKKINLQFGVFIIIFHVFIPFLMFESTPTAAGLAKNKTIRILSLQQNGVNAVAAKALGMALERNTTLTTLDLRTNCIQTSGAQSIAKVSYELYVLCVFIG
jgi:Ran GTPase-activating protein (RanGAP) involved in mRNA processing and transport